MGEVVLLTFPFTDASGAKRRPALVLLDAGDEDVVVARITSSPALSEFDVRLQGWQDAGLLLPSTVRLHKLATLEKRLVTRTLGALSADDRAAVTEVLAGMWGDV